MASKARDRIASVEAHLNPSATAAAIAPSTSEQQPVTSISPEKIAEFRRKYGYKRADSVVVDGLSHLALVSSDMERTVKFYGECLGIPLTKTIELPDGGQHFFFDIGRGESLAYFWFPRAPKAAPGVASVNPKLMMKGDFTTAHGSMNHVAFNVPEEKLKEYRKRLLAHKVICTPIVYHADVPSGYALGKDETTSFVSFYFFGPDGEYLEFTAQAKQFTPEDDILHLPKTAKDALE